MCARMLCALLSAAAAMTSAQAQAHAPADPATQYCMAQGGRIVHETDGRGDDLGVCRFDDGRRCDEQALLRGDCAAGGIHVLSDTVHARFRCAGGRTVDAVFRNGKHSSVSLVLSDGRRLSLPQAPSGSGARYADAREALVFWNKGDTAFIEEQGRTTYRGCVAMR